MGNGFLSCKGCNPFCCRSPHYEINNNVFGNYGEMKVNKDKKIITNIFMPNCQVKISPEGSIDKKNNNKDNNKSNQSKKRKNKADKKNEKKESTEMQNNASRYFNEAVRRSSEKTVPLALPVPYISSGTQTYKKNFENQYNADFLEYINKLRTKPNSVIEDIEFIMKKNLTIIEDKDCMISEKTNEIIKLRENYIYFDNIKDFLENVEPVNELKLNDNLNIKYIYDSIELTDKKISEIVINKRKEIIYEFPNCFFYPVFIKDIKFNLIVLLSNNKIKEKLFYKFSDFYVTIFNVKNNRFFAILCFA
jgi:hypothetical protein